jgi:site-specific DNA-methyltransferase (adenine-specific)
MIPFPNKKYNVIYADPPWKYGEWGKGGPNSIFPKDKNIALPMPYGTMTVDEIENLPIKEIASENCELYLWTTQKYLPTTFDIMNTWGFKYCQTLVWCKKPRGTGQGGVYCPTTEFLLLGRKGRMPKIKRIDTTWWEIKRQKRHSKKPDFFRDMLTQIYGNVPKIELFARERVLGWDAWGNEV